MHVGLRAPPSARGCAPSAGPSSSGAGYRARALSVRASGEPAEASARPAPLLSRRSLAAGLAASLVLASGGAVAPRPAGAEPPVPFLKSTGGRGTFADGEEALVALRMAKEEAAWKQLEAEELRFQQEISNTQNGKLCATPFGVDVVGITEAIALVGALVGGVAAGKRKEEVDKLNEQLRKINMQLRQQARAGTVYAPGLTYAPASDKTIADILKVPEAPVAPPPPPPQAHAAVSDRPISQIMSATTSVDEEEMTADHLACRDALKAGKKLLKESNGAAAMVRFEKALMLSRAVGDKVQQRRAYRGLAASSRLQGQYTAAIKHLHDVLEISRQMHEFTGDADAYGTIADCYTDMGNFDEAAKYYDRYIAVMNSDGVLV